MKQIFQIQQKIIKKNKKTIYDEVMRDVVEDAPDCDRSQLLDKYKI